MKLFFREPTYGNLILENATSSPFAGSSSTPIGGQTVALQPITAAHFCFSQSAYLDSFVVYTANETITYYDDPTNTWKTKSESPFEQITCENTTQATSSVAVTLASSSIQIDGGYNGANFQEWLFVAGVIIFLLSFMVWGRFNFTRQ